MVGEAVEVVVGEAVEAMGETVALVASLRLKRMEIIAFLLDFVFVHSVLK